MSLTVLFYSANLKPEPFFSRIIAKLKKVTGDLPIISIAHKPVDVGKTNIIVNMPVSTYSVYQQILIGARLANTRFIAMAEDDCLYTPDHYQFRPPTDDTFYYSRSRWWIEREGFYRWRKRTVMATCICNRELYIRWAENLFKRFPVHPETREGMTGFSEPGRYETVLKLPQVKIDHFTTANPVVTFNEKPSLGGLRRINPTDIIQPELPYFGSASKLWSELHD